MINEAELREMTPSERRKLARSLAAVDYPHPLLGIYLARGRRLGALISIIACTVLVGWIIVLVLTLHDSFHAQHWTGAWVGFDVILLFAFAATGWAFWRGRQIVIACLMVTATLLCCDAWFDVVLDAGTSDVWLSVASAVVVELPLAFLMLNAARRLIRLSAVVAVSEAGDNSDCDRLPEDELPPLWKIPLFGVGRRPGSHHYEALAGQTQPTQTRADQTRADQTRANEIRANQTRADQAQASEKQGNQTREKGTGSSRSRPDEYHRAPAVDPHRLRT